VNENMVDVKITPTRRGEPATIEYRPESAAFSVTGTVNTVAKGKESTVSIPVGPAPDGSEVTGLVNCVGAPDCSGAISGDIPVGYKSPLSSEPEFVGRTPTTPS
jgi:D-alanyl-D-alanine carboxypeptidase/D-alanyl-D-alanine-endopeptidase (penicillin-binding protein 4)